MPPKPTAVAFVMRGTDDDATHSHPARRVTSQRGWRRRGVQGCRDLTATGRRQAEALAQRLARDLRERPTAVYCSVIPRAVETAEIIGAAWENLTIVQDCGLCTWHTPAQADGKLWAEYGRDSSLAGGGVFRPFQQGNESWSELVGRTGRTLEQITARHRHETVLVVAHAETTNASFIIFGGLPLSAMDLAALFQRWGHDSPFLPSLRRHRALRAAGG